MRPRTELLAPAGTPEAGYAALHYGADAVYLGLSRFSARAEAGNFSPAELADFVGFAHGLTPRRNVYLALNTLVENGELETAAETLLAGVLAGVDAVIVQDFGVLRLARDAFPDLPLHASTQLAVHSLDGALAARDLGFRRVTLARELTFGEIDAIVRESGLEVETFIHGALCYSYSGLCLFSALASGRSGNRGRCSYPCRQAFRSSGRDQGHPFSLKDLALLDRARDLASAGVLSLKIEGRKKSPLYVAAVVDYYRRLLDGGLDPNGAEEAEARMQTIFARPWTRFFLDGPRDPGVVDLEVVGHRGAPLGKVAAVEKIGGEAAVAFRAELAMERHDGVQTDVPGEERPFGFPVDALYRREGKRWKSVFAANAGDEVAVPLPADAPTLSPGRPLYLASSQAVKRAYPYDRPKPGSTRVPRIVAWKITVKRAGGEDRVVVVCEAETRLPTAYSRIAEQYGENETTIIAWTCEREVDAFPARDADGAEAAARTAFSRLGDFGFALGDWRFDNPDRLFIQSKIWNDIRRGAMRELAAAVEAREKALLDGWFAAIRAFPEPSPARAARPDAPRRGIYVERLEYLAHFDDGDFSLLDEIAVEIPVDDDPGWRRGLDSLADRVGTDKLRLSLPLIARDIRAKKDRGRLLGLRDAGYRRWLAVGIGGWRALRGLDIEAGADWPLYAFNRFAAAQLLDMGFDAFTLSPEDGEDNMAKTVAAFPGRAVLAAWMHPPMFISAACVHSNLGLCRNGDASQCDSRPLALSMRDGPELTATPYPCGTVTSRDFPLDMTDRAGRLGGMGLGMARIDFRWRRFTPGEVLHNLRNVISLEPVR